MKDIKITEQNYKELFECAGFEQTNIDGSWSKASDATIMGEEGFIELLPVSQGKGFTVVAKFYCNGYHTQLRKGGEVTSTAEIDSLFYPFLDKPLVWRKKWDFESVFGRVFGDTVQRDKLSGSHDNGTLRVQAFSRLLFVMEELNKEYKESKHYYYEVKAIDIGGKVVEYQGHKYTSIDPTAVFVLGSEAAAKIFIRDNEADLKTFFNIC